MKPSYVVENLIEVKAPILLHNFSGKSDAGRASYIATTHLSSTLKKDRIASFSVDDFVDMRTYRPFISVSDWQVKDISFPEITLDLYYDDKGMPFLVLSGPEPSICWKSFVQEIIELIKPFGVERAFTFAGAPSNVPHTRKGEIDSIITKTSNGEKKLSSDESECEKENDKIFRFPTSMDLFLQYQLKNIGIEGTALISAIPFYLSDSDYPQGAYSLLEKFSFTTGLDLPLGDLAATCDYVTQVLENNPDIAQNANLIHSLEEEFDKNKHESNIASSAVSGDNFSSDNDLAKTIEAFLKHQDESPDRKTKNIYDSSQKNGENNKNVSFFKKFFKKRDN